MENKISDIFIKNVFITGLPKTGKTYLIKKVLERYSKKIFGFYTQEIIFENKRVGFSIINDYGDKEIFALKHEYIKNKDIFIKEKYNGLIKHYKKYDVLIDNFEKIAVNYLENKILNENISYKNIFIIDEIGSIELLSERFCHLVIKILNSNNYLLATLRYNTYPFVDDIKKFRNSKIFKLEKNNFNKIYSSVINWIEKI